MNITHANRPGTWSPRVRPTALAGLAAAALGLLAAPAGAAENNEPLDPNGKPMCGKTTSDGETRWYRQGERIVERDVDGKETTKKCGENGEWVVVAIVAPRPVAVGGVAGAHAGLTVFATGPRTAASVTTGASAIGTP